MDLNKAKILAENFKGFACKGCTEGWLEEHDNFTDPIQEIKECAAFGLISFELQDKLVNEVIEIKSRD